MRRSAFARSGHSNPFGKIGSPVGQLRLAARTEEALRAEAHRAGVPMLEFVRRLIEIRIHGRAVVEREISIHLDLIDSGSPKATESKGGE